MILADLIARYERECLDGLAPATQRDYRRILTVLGREFGHMAPEAVKRRDIAEFLNVATGRVARNRAVTLLGQIYHKAIAKWCISDTLANPTQGVERWPEKPRRRYVGNDELQRFRAICPDALQIEIDLAILTGQRQGDLLALTWGQVHADHIEFRQAKTNRHLGVRITPELAAVLKRAKAMTPAGEHVIRNRFGDRFTDYGFRALWGRHMRRWERMGHDGFHCHDLRAKSGSDAPTLQAAYERLGHSDIAITRRHYERNIRMVDALR